MSLEIQPKKNLKSSWLDNANRPAFEQINRQMLIFAFVSFLFSPLRVYVFDVGIDASPHSASDYALTLNPECAKGQVYWCQDLA